MKKILFCSLLTSFFWLGCSKEEDSYGDAGTAAPVADAQPADPNAQSAPVFSQHLNEVKTDLDAQKYQDLTAKLALMNRVPKTPEQEKEFRRTVWEVQEELRMRAEQNEAARRAYQNFGRAMTGR